MRPTSVANDEGVVHQLPFIVPKRWGKVDIYGMVKDVVPELREQIETRFRSNVMADRQLRSVSQRIESGRASLHDAHAYAERLGEDLSKALTMTLTEDNLPNGKLYFNIAERTVIPALERNYEMVNDAAANIQKSLDKKAKIGLGSVRADFPRGRVQGLIDKLTEEDITPDEVIKWLTEPIINNSEAFADDFVDANARFRSETGLKTKIVRTADPNCCKWCADLEGEYDYGSAPEDIYRRHEYCRCTVTFKSEKVSQNVWSKRTWQTDPADLDRRKTAGTRQERSPEDIVSQVENLARDVEIRKMMDETGYSRTASRRATSKKTPAEIEAEIRKIKERQQNIRR